MEENKNIEEILTAKPSLPIPKKLSRRIPEVFEVSAVTEEKLVNAIAEAFKSRESVGDPIIYAKKMVKRCLKGETADGKPWWNCPRTLEDRFKVIGFDVKTMQALGSVDSGGRKRKDAIEPGITTKLPPNSNLPKTVRHTRIHAPISGSELKEFNRRLNAYLEEFPHLKSAADMGMLEVLVKAEIAGARRLNAILEGEGTRAMSSQIDDKIAKVIKDALETLGISGAQRAKLKNNITDGTIADLVEMYEAYTRDGNYIEVERLWRLEELALLLRKHDRLDPAGNPEIDEAIFVIYSDGITVEQARKIIPDPYAADLTKYKEQYIELMRLIHKKEDKVV